MAEQFRAALERRKAVQQRIGVSRSTLYSWIAKGEFPAPVKIGARAVAWDAAAVDDWIARRIRAGKAAA